MAVVVAQQNQLVASAKANLIAAWFVVDASGSMAGGRWKRAQNGIRACLSQLTDTDFVAIITFNDKVKVVDLGLKQELKSAAFFGMNPGGGTALYDGIALMVLEATKVHLALSKRMQGTGVGVISYVVVLTDGEDTCSKLKLGDTQKILAEINRLNHFKILFAGINLDQKSSGHLRALGSVGDKDIEFRDVKTNDDIKNLFEHITIQIQLQKKQTVIVQDGQNTAVITSTQSVPLGALSSGGGGGGGGSSPPAISHHPGGTSVSHSDKKKVQAPSSSSSSPKTTVTPTVPAFAQSTSAPKNVIPQEVIYSGTLKKQRLKGIGLWTSRMFKLYADRIVYYERDQPEGSIQLSSVRGIENGKAGAFTIKTAESTFPLMADTEAIKAKWIEEINKAIEIQATSKYELKSPQPKNKPDQKSQVVSSSSPASSSSSSSSGSGNWDCLIDGAWKPYPLEDCNVIESHYKKTLFRYILTINSSYQTEYIFDFIKKVQINTETGVERSIRKNTSSNVWEISIDNKWHPYNSVDNQALENFYQKSPDLEFNIVLSFSRSFSTQYKIDLKRMVQINLETKIERSIRRS